MRAQCIYSGLFDLIFSHYKHARIADSDAASSPWVLFLSAALVEVFVVESSAVSMNERSYAYVIRNSNNFGLLQCYKICKKRAIFTAIALTHNCGMFAICIKSNIFLNVAAARVYENGRIFFFFLKVTYFK